MPKCLYCSSLTAAGCPMCNPTEHYCSGGMFVAPVQPTQLDRIEAKLDELLARKKRVVKPRGDKDGYPDWFEKVWAEYPKRSGSNPKRKAFEACNARVKQARIDGNEGMIDFLWSRTVDYCKYCDAVYDDKRYVMQASTFYGYSKPYLGDFTIPDTVKKSAIPRDNDEMLTWAVKCGMRQPHQGESWNQYRAYVEGEA